MVHTSGTTGEQSRRIPARDTRDWRDEVGIHSVHVSRFMRHGPWAGGIFSILLEGVATENQERTTERETQA